MKKLLFISLSLLALTIATEIGWQRYDKITGRETVKRQVESGCRWIKFPGENWQHPPSCDGKNHGNH